MYVLGVSVTNKDGSFFTPRRKGNEAASLLSQPVTAVYTIVSLVIVWLSADVSVITLLLYTTITLGNSNPKLNKLPSPTVSLMQTVPSLYIQAWLTMRKIFLDRKLAMNYVSLFVQVWSLTWNHSIPMVLKLFSWKLIMKLSLWQTSLDF